MTVSRSLLQEALRLYPVAPSTDRVAQQDMYVGGHFIPKGTSLWILLYAIQHSSEHWDDPEVFNPVSMLCFPCQNLVQPMSESDHVQSSWTHKTF